MKMIIDRFEGEYAICEVIGEKSLRQIKKTDLPAEAQEGSVLSYILSGEIEIDIAETDRRQHRIKAKMNNLWK